MKLSTTVKQAVHIFIRDHLDRDSDLFKGLWDILWDLRAMGIISCHGDVSIGEIQGILEGGQYHYELPLDYKIHYILDVLKNEEPWRVHLNVTFILKFYIFLANECKEFKAVSCLKDGCVEEEYLMLTNVFARTDSLWEKDGLKFPADLFIQSVGISPTGINP